MKLIKILLTTIGVALIAGVTWLLVSPPDLLRVGSNYSARIICSNAFLAGRDPQDVLKNDVQAPGHPMLSVMQVTVKEAEQGSAASRAVPYPGVVEAGLFGLIGQGLAVYRPGFGCTSVPDGRLDLVTQVPAATAPADLAPNVEWPNGSLVNVDLNEKLTEVLNDDGLTGPGMRAIVIVKDGRVIAERYASGFTPQTPLLGWSMAKTVTAGLVGRLVQQGQVDVNDKGLFRHWQGDRRNDIRLSDLLGMASDLQWNESYGTVSDVTRLLFLEPDTASAATKPPLNNESGEDIGKLFNYSSGTTVVVSRHLQDQHDNADEGLLMAKNALFQPLGMTTAVIEPDARGTLTGGSFMYASARDWARYGLFLLRDGVWNGERLLPEQFVSWMVKPHPANKKSQYGRGHVWLTPPGSSRYGKRPKFDHNSFWMAGHDGQSVAILPDENLLVVRLGLTPSKLGYKPARLVNAVVEALE